MPNCFSRLDSFFGGGVGARGGGRRGKRGPAEIVEFRRFFFFRVAVFCFGWLAFFLKVDFFFWMAGIFLR